MSGEETERKNENQTSANSGQNDKKNTPMSRNGTILITLYVLAVSVLLFYGIVSLWPVSTAATNQTSTNPVTIFFLTFSVGDEARIILIVGMAGALGSMVHVLRSFYWYVGNRELVVSWWAKYFFLPFVGATLGIIFYLVIRGGFFSPQATVAETAPFSFAAVAALVGMFSEAAVSKLKDVAENLLKPPPEGNDASKAKKKVPEEKNLEKPNIDKG